MMAVIPVQLQSAICQTEVQVRKQNFQVAVIDLRLGAATWGRMLSWWTSIVNRPAKSRASEFSAMAAPVS
jgi:hypothetical protein